MNRIMSIKNRFANYAAFVVFAVITLVSLLSTILPLFDFEQWYFRVFDYPRLQTFFLSLIALVWFYFFYFKKSRQGVAFIVVLSLIILVQGYKAWPYTPLGIKQVKWAEKNTADTTTISLFICNVLQDNTSYELVVSKIKKYSADIVITTESNKIWENKLEVIKSEYPYLVPIPQDNKYGMHVYSKLRLRNTSKRFLLEDDIPSVRTEVQLRSGEWVHLFVVHPRPPFPTEDEDSKERDAEIIMVGREARKEKTGVIVAGDFNDVAWSETTELFQEVSGFLDPRRGRGFYNTFHAKYPVFRWPLDHLFHSSHFKLVEIKRVEKVDSDHFPMFIKLSYEPEDKGEQPEVQPDDDTEEKADEAIEEGKADVKDKQDKKE